MSLRVHETWKESRSPSMCVEKKEDVQVDPLSRSRRLYRGRKSLLEAR